MLTDKQKAFADAVQATATSEQLITQTQAIYDTDRNTARVMVAENLQKPNIVQYLGDRGYRALDVMNEAMNDKTAKWADRLRAAEGLADRQFGRPSTTVNVNSTTVAMSIDLTQKDVVIST